MQEQLHEIVGGGEWSWSLAQLRLEEGGETRVEVQGNVAGEYHFAVIRRVADRI